MTYVNPWGNSKETKDKKSSILNHNVDDAEEAAIAKEVASIKAKKSNKEADIRPDNPNFKNGKLRVLSRSELYK